MTKTIENKKVNNFQTVKAFVFNSINLLSKHVVVEFDEKTKGNYNTLVIDSTLKDTVKDIVISKEMIECIYAFDTVVLANSNLKDKKDEFTNDILQSFKDTENTDIDTEEIKQACNDFYKDFTKQAMKIVKGKKYNDFIKALDNLTKTIALGEFKLSNCYMKRVFNMEMKESTLKDIQKMLITFDSKQAKSGSKNYRCNGLVAILRYTLQKQNAYKRKALQFELKDVMKAITVMTDKEIEKIDVTQYATLHGLDNGNKLKLTSKVYNHIAKNVVIIPETIKQSFDTIK